MFVCDELRAEGLAWTVAPLASDTPRLHTMTLCLSFSDSMKPCRHSFHNVATPSHTCATHLNKYNDSELGDSAQFATVTNKSKLYKKHSDADTDQQGRMEDDVAKLRVCHVVAPYARLP